jgi:hypothetical protein
LKQVRRAAQTKTIPPLSPVLTPKCHHRTTKNQPIPFRIKKAKRRAAGLPCNHTQSCGAAEPFADKSKIQIGKSIPNAGVYVLDERLGAPGEIRCAGMSNVALASDRGSASHAPSPITKIHESTSALSAITRTVLLTGDVMGRGEQT